MTPSLSREHILATCFSDIPSSINHVTLRPLTAGSFTLLSRLGNPMIVGAALGGADQASMFEAVIQYIWIHSALIEKVICIETKEQIPQNEIAELGFNLSFGDVMAFLEGYKSSAQRMQAALAEVEDEGDTEGKSESGHIGSPHLSLVLEEPETPSESATYSGSCPSSAPFPTSTPLTSLTEPTAAGPASSPETPAPSPIPEPSSNPSEESGPD